MDQALSGRRPRTGCGKWISRLLTLFAVSILALIANATLASAITEKPFIAPVMAKLPKGTRVHVDAERITYDAKTKIATALGFVKMTYGPYTLVASKVSFNQTTGAFDANGSVEIREPNGNVMLADSIDLRNQFAQGFATHVTTLLTNNGTITAEYVKRVNRNITIFEKATYTACRDCKTRSGHPLWAIVTDQTTHDSKTHNLYHVNPKLQINGATVIGLPYLSMADPSVTRRTGFLLPDLKSGDVYGFGVVTPYFWAITPSTDLTFRPMWTTYQGPVADLEWRQKTETGQYNLRGFGVYQMHDLPYPENGPVRGAVESHGAFKANEDWNYGWNGTFATDTNFLNSYGYDERKYAVNDIYATGLWDQTYVSAQMLNFGSMRNTIDPNILPYAMPFISGQTIYRDLPMPGQLELNWNAYSLARQSPQTPFPTVNDGTNQTRATTQMNWHTQIYTDVGAVVTPFANLRSDILMSENVPGAASTFESQARVLPAVGVDMRMPFIANLPYGQSIITPVFQVVSSADEGATTGFGNEDSVTLNLDHTSLFLADRFTGTDRYEGGTRADLGVTYSLIGNNGGFIRASAGESIHIAGQNSYVAGSGLSNNESDLVAAIVFQPWNNLSFSYEARVKNDLSGLNRQEAVASLSFDDFSTNISYLDFGAEPAYGRLYREQWVAADAKVKLSDGWNLFGGVTYDFVASVLAQRTIGIEFDCECMNFKFAYTGTEDSVSHLKEDKVVLSIQFATLGKTGVTAKF